MASASPRRRELLSGLDIPFEVKVLPAVCEDYPDTLPKEDVALFIAKEKASAYSVTFDELLITADTVVVVDDEILGKPRDAEEAHAMLRALSGKTHRVISGVCLTTQTEQRAFAVTTNVTFKELSDEEIDYYVTHYSPLDKAGAYGIQEWIGYTAVTGIEGSYFNVVGLPVQRIADELKKMNVVEI